MSIYPIPDASMAILTGVGQIRPNGRTIPIGPHARTGTLPLQPGEGAGVYVRALGVFKRNKIPIEEKAHALHLHMAGLSSWEIADAMGDRYGRKPSH
ncbi:MAG: hypothetical protein RXQ62_05525 [Nitrososphaeria archaeon]